MVSTGSGFRNPDGLLSRSYIIPPNYRIVIVSVLVPIQLESCLENNPENWKFSLVKNAKNSNTILLKNPKNELSTGLYYKFTVYPVTFANRFQNSETSQMKAETSFLPKIGHG